MTLLPRAAETGVRSVRVPDPDSAGSYFVEYRRAQDRDVGSALDGPDWCCEMYDAGVSVVYREAGQTASVLQPTGPAETYSLGADDGTWTSPSGGLVLDVLQDNGAAGAVVRVKVQSSSSSFTTAPEAGADRASPPGGSRHRQPRHLVARLHLGAVPVEPRRRPGRGVEGFGRELLRLQRRHRQAAVPDRLRVQARLPGDHPHLRPDHDRLGQPAHPDDHRSQHPVDREHPDRSAGQLGLRSLLRLQVVRRRDRRSARPRSWC